MNANPKNVPRAFWRINWKLWAWRAVTASTVAVLLYHLLHSQSFAGAAYYGGSALICAAAGLSDPAYLNRTLTQIFQNAHSGARVQSRAALVLGTFGIGLVSLSLVLWLSSG